MSTRAGTHLLRRRMRVDLGVHVVLGVLICVTTFLVTATPPYLTGAYDDAVREVLASTPDARKDIVVAGATRDDSLPVTAATFDQVEGGVLDALGPEVVGSLGDPTHAAATGEYRVADPITGRSPTPATRILGLRLQSDVASRVRFVSGGPPTSARRVDAPPAARAVSTDPTVLSVDIALAERTARALRLVQGDRVLLTPWSGGGAYWPVLVRVSGIYVPTDPGDSFWSADRRMVEPAVLIQPDGGRLRGAVALVPDDSISVLHRSVLPGFLQYTWRFPLVTAAVDTDSVDALTEAVGRVRVSAGGQLGPFPLSARTGVVDLLDGYRSDRATTRALVSIVFAALVVVASVVIALCVYTALQRRRSDLALLRARGASPGRLVGGPATEAVIVAAPTAALGASIAVAAVDGRAAGWTWQGPVIVTAAAVLLAVGTAHALLRTTVSGDSAAQRRTGSRRRLAVESVVLVVALLAVLAVRREGLLPTEAGFGADARLTLTPILVSVAATAVVLRGYPLALRSLTRLAGRARGAVTFLGMAGASRTKAVNAVLLLLLPALTLCVFAGVVQRDMQHDAELVAWRSVGADVRLGVAALSSADTERLREVRDVTGVLSARVDDSARLTVGRETRDVFSVAVDLRAYARLLADTPLAFDVPPEADAPASGTGAIPVLSSGDDRGPVRLMMEGRVLSGHVVGHAPMLGGDGRDDVVLVPLSALRGLAGEGLPGDTAFLRGTPDVGELRAAVHDDEAPSLSSRVDELERLDDTALRETARTAFATGMVSAGAYAVAGVLLLLAITASDRRHTAAQLRTLGLTGAQSRAVATYQLVPGLLIAAVVGTVLGLAMPPLLDVDLGQTQPVTAAKPAGGGR